MPRTVSLRLLPGCRGWLPAAELRRVARRVLDAEDVAPDVGVEVVLADSATVQDLNRLYRGRDEPTDVLSFAQMDAYEPPEPSVQMPAFIDSPDEEASLGEVIVCIPYVLGVLGIGKEGALGEVGSGAGALKINPSQLTPDQRRAVSGQVSHLLVHGLLHVLGYDHEESDEDSRRMQAREDELLADLGYSGAYQHGQH